MQKPVIKLDGLAFDTIEGFFDTFGTQVLGCVGFGSNLDAFNDVLRGGFGTPDGGFVLRWTNSQVSRQKLGYDATIQFIERKLTTCHPSNREHFYDELVRTRNNEGDTLFDIICEIIRDHGPGGEQAQDGIELILD